MSERRVVCTGMGIITGLGDNPDDFVDGLMAGRSAITNWTFYDDERVYSKVGGDLSGYDAEAALDKLRARVPEDAHARMRKIFRTAPFSTRLTILTAVSAWLDAGLPFGEEGVEPGRRGVLVGGHNLNEHYLIRNYDQFLDEPDWIDSLSALLTLDTDHAGSVSEILGCRGAQYSVGGACASANVALKNAVDEIMHHDHDQMLVVGAALDFSPMGLHAMALMGAISVEGFNDRPSAASRPYDTDREGFIPSHGSAALLLEEYEHARARGATMYGEVRGVVATSDANHLTNPSPDGQEATIKRVLRKARLAPEDVSFVSAHATSTPLGDLSELEAIRRAFGGHAKNLKINAPKSMLGHTCWSAPAVETVAALVQMQRGRLHPSINIESLDPAVDVDVCADGPVDHDFDVFLKNSFGFGGTNCCAVWTKVH